MAWDILILTRHLLFYLIVLSLTDEKKEAGKDESLSTVSCRVRSHSWVSLSLEGCSACGL